MIDHAQLLENVSYDPETGLFRLKKPSYRRPAGVILNWNGEFRQKSGRVVRRTEISLKGGFKYSAGRLAWFYMTGEWPPGEVDHCDTDGWNNRWNNLRLASRSQNQANTRCYKSNKLGLKGVHKRDNGTFRAMIQHHGRRISLGTFNTEEAAYAAYHSAAVDLHGEFARAA